MNRNNWKEMLGHRKRLYSAHGTDKTQQTRANAIFQMEKGMFTVQRGVKYCFFSSIVFPLIYCLCDTRYQRGRGMSGDEWDVLLWYNTSWCSLGSILGETLMSCRQSEPCGGRTKYFHLFVGGRSQSYGGLEGGAGDGGVAEPAGFRLGEGGRGGAEGGRAWGLDLVDRIKKEDPHEKKI